MKETFKLYELISQMSTSEKRLFKLEASLYDKKRKKGDLIDTFEAINKALKKNQTYQEIDNLIKISATDKHRLFNKILDKLVFYNRKNGHAANIFEYAKIELLFENGFYEESKIRLKKLQSKIEGDGINHLNLLIENLNYKIALRTGMKLEDKILIHKQISEQLSTLDLHHQYKSMSINASKLKKPHHNIDKKALNEFLNEFDYLLQTEIDKTRKENLLLLLTTYSYLSIALQDNKSYKGKIENIINRMLDLYKNEMDSINMLGALNNYLSISIRNNDDAQIRKVIDLSFDHIIKSNLSSLKSPYISNLSYVYIYFPSFSNLDIHSIIRNELADNPNTKSDTYKLNMLFRLVFIYFIKGEYESSFQALNEYFYKMNIHIDSNYYYVLLIIKIFDLWYNSNYISAQSVVNQIQYSYRKKNIKNEALNSAIKLIARINRSYKNGVMNNKLFTELMNIIEEYKQAEVINYLNMMKVNNFLDLLIKKCC